MTDGELNAEDDDSNMSTVSSVQGGDNDIVDGIELDYDLVGGQAEDKRDNMDEKEINNQLKSRGMAYRRAFNEMA